MWIALATVFIFVVALMPFAIAYAWRIGAIDVPKDFRRMHERSVPRNGGMAIFLGVLMGYSLLDGSLFTSVALACGFSVFLIGLIDDVLSLSPWVKLSVQLFASIATVLCATEFHGIQAAASVLWLLVLTNAHNFIDGLDGLFGGVASAEAVSLGVLLWMCGAWIEAECSLLLGIACVAFLLFNRHPAKIFAGDCGSGSVGFLLGALSLPLFQNMTAGIGASAVLLFAYPLTDLCCAVLRRVLRGKSPFCADRGHLHHRICDAGVGKGECVSILWSITAGLCTLGLLIGAFELYAEASVASVLLAVLLIFIRHRIVAKI